MRDARLARLVLELRHAGVTETRVLAAIERVPREAFVTPGLEGEAYEDRALPIACGQTISQPYVVARMTEALAPGERDRILEIGTGSGYQAAVLAQLCRRVYSIERHRDLHQQADERLRGLGVRNVTTRLGDGWRGWPEQAPFDGIMITAAAPEIPAALVAQLRPGGRMVLPLGETWGDQDLMVATKAEDGSLAVQRLFAVRFVPMLHGLASGGPGSGGGRTW